MARNILVVEDDRNISDLIRMYLEKEGFEVRSAYDGGKAIEEYDKQAPDMVLLDIMLPVVDGWGVCAHIREKGKTPIIMLTAKSDVGDRITGLEMGADDYLVKPFEMKELMARINAVLRRSEIPDDTKKKLVFDKLVINLDSYELLVDGKKVDTPPKELELLPLGAKIITLELAVRFLTDYLDGDRYFRVAYPEHNLVRARAQLEQIPGIRVMSSATDNLEVITPAADKGVALGMLCRELGTDLDHAAAIGDSENDLEMLNAVALPIAMGNASAAVKNLCLRETLTNAQDGVAAAIDRIIAENG